MSRKIVDASVDRAIVDLSRRELGALHTKRFTNRLAASQDLVLRLDVYKKLERHRKRVNSVSFSQYGDFLVFGSDDWKIIVWDWQSGGVKLFFHSYHNNIISQAKFMPYTNDQTIVSCGDDGQVRCAQISDGGQVQTKWLGSHIGRVSELGIEPSSPYNFFSCGRDGLVQHFDLRTSMGTHLFTCQSYQGPAPFVSLNTIAIDPRNPNLFVVGRAEEYARLYDIRKYRSNGSTDIGIRVDNFCPRHLIGYELPITGLAFSDQSELLVSYNEDFIYRFAKKMGLGPDLAQIPTIMDVDLEEEPQAYKGHINYETVIGVKFFGPKSEYIMSGSDCGRIFIWNKKGGELIRVLEANKYVNCIESHPDTTVLASCGIENDIKIWTPKACDRATMPTNIEQKHISD